MNSRIFRGQTDAGKWVYGGYYKQFGMHCIKPDSKIPQEVNPKTVTQYTGLKDSEGRRIFEGDTMEYRGKKCPTCYHKGKNYHQPYPILWKKEEAQFIAQNIDNWMDPCTWKEMYVIGNKFDNPELLKNMALADSGENNE